jgi:hypothetical protein
MNLLLHSPSNIVNPLARQRFMGFGTGSSGGADFSPLSLAPLIWCDATRLALNNGDPVAQFSDLSGNNYHYISSGTARPTFVSNGINGRPAIEGDGVDDAMTRAAIGEHLDWWAFIVAAPVTMGTAKELWALNDFPQSIAIYRLLETNAASTININQGVGLMSSSITLANGVCRAIRLEGHTTSVHYQADNGSPISKTGLTGNYPTTGNDGRLGNFVSGIFARGGGTGLWFNARIGELVLGSGTLTSGQLTSMWTYLAQKWGTSIP